MAFTVPPTRAPEPKELVLKPKGKPGFDDERLKSLIKVVAWQGRIIVLLLVVIVILAIVKTDSLKLPMQKAVASAPPISEQSFQYNVFTYQGPKPVKHGDIVRANDVSILGQIFDYKEIKKKWPDLIFTVNGAAIPVNDNGAYAVDMTLKIGPNVIETAMSVSGQEYERRQVVLTYNPQIATSTPPVIQATTTTPTKP
ncbi:MAG: hypothetical protein PHC53_00430 [Patescibacteria group bacterium]|nr:hypothetical protein [Patescibacteria group bacterium]